LSRKGGGTIATLYYISPQIWAWKAGRRFKMAQHLDSMAVIFPFERQSYADTALPVHFVGHPFVDPDYEAPVAYDEGGPVLLLPGSRRQAVRRIFPVMLAGFAEFAERRAVVLCPSAEIEEVLRAARPPANVEIRRLAEGAERDRPLGAAAVLTSSGTMSMHCALAAIPGAVVYRANPLTYLLGRWLVKIPYIGIANLLLQSPMYPEYIQGAAQPKALARELQDCIHNPDRRRRTAGQAGQLRQILGEQTIGDVADWVLQNLG
jgi:lipid-A-disaccharide synthase